VNEAAAFQDNSRANTILLSFALFYFLIEWVPSFFGSYGYFIDEFYYIACSERLALGYVDHPPLSIFLLRLVRAVIGDSLPAIRLVPSLAGAATIMITGLIARRLGAGLYGQALAAGTAMAGSIWHVMFSMYTMNSLSILIWALCFLILVEIERNGNPRLWLWFGVAIGLGLENKHTIVLLLLGLGIGLVVTRARRHFANRWIWIGAGIAILLLLPNLIWQMMHDWPSLEFYRNADMYKNLPTPPLEVLMQQVLFMNLAALPVWIAGIVFFLVTDRGKPYRHLGWIFIVLFLLMLIGQKSRPDRIAAAYTILFAGGGVQLEAFLRVGRVRLLKFALPAALVLFGLAFAPLGLPVLSPGITASYSAALGIVPQIERGEGKRSELPQWLADRFGWEEIVDDVENASKLLRPDERGQAIILVPSYGHAGAIELFGRGRTLPPVYTGQNSYHSWGPPEDPVDAAIAVGFDEDTLRWLFDEVELVHIHDCEWCMSWRDEMPIWLARGQKIQFREVWPEFRHYE
jgi:hypothetical protein